MALRFWSIFLLEVFQRVKLVSKVRLPHPRGTLSVLMLLLAWSGALHAEVPSATSAEGQIIKIGFITPLSGAQALYGEDSQKIVQLLAARLKEQKRKYRYEIVVEDGQCGLANAAATAAQKLIHVDGVRFIVATCSGEVLQIAPIAERAGVVVIGFAASHPGISGLGPHVFRNYINMSDAIRWLSAQMLAEHSGKIAVITEEASFTLGIKAELLKHLGSRLASAEDFKAEENDYRSLILRTKRAKPEAYYLNAAGPNSYINLFRQLRQSGEKQPVYAYYQPEDKDVLKALGTLQDGTKYLGLPTEFEGAEGRDFAESFKAKYPEGPRLPLLAATAWDSIQILTQAIDAVGPDSERVAKFLHSAEFKGVTGRIRFNERGDVEELACALKRIAGGKAVTINSHAAFPKDESASRS